MSDAGTDLSKIGWYGSLVGFPYAFKYLWSPLLDRYAPPFLGRRKGWLLIIQSLLVVSIGTMALQDPAQNLDLLAINSVIIAFLGASLDIVADAYRTEVLTEAELPVGASIFTTGYRVALIVAFAGASKLFANVFQSWQPVYLVMAGFMLVSLVLTLIAPSTEAKAPETLADAVILPFADFFQRRGVVYGASVLLFIVSYKISDAMMNAMSIPFLKASCFTQGAIGDINGFMGMIAAIVGALLGGVILLRMRQNLQRTLNSSMAATILIADQRGRDEILKLLRGEPSALRGAAGTMRRRLRTEPVAPLRAVLPRWARNRWARGLIAFLLPAAVGAGFYALLTMAR